VTPARFRATSVALLLTLVLACASTGNPPSPAASAAPASARDEHAGHDMGGTPPVTLPAGSLITEADVRFMQMMIAHHAQAVHMTRMAEGAGASPRVLRLAQKIDLSQAGEIALMQDWLRGNGQFAPDTSSWRTMTMPGMLSAAQLRELAAAKGTEFDRQFLTLMIKHHEGALQMVAELLATPRAAQDVDVNVLANEVEATQTAEIGLMWQMLAELD
jgi:uncharacterized protein (DUF305 family)